MFVGSCTLTSGLQHKDFWWILVIYVPRLASWARAVCNKTYYQGIDITTGLSHTSHAYWSAGTEINNNTALTLLTAVSQCYADIVYSTKRSTGTSITLLILHLSVPKWSQTHTNTSMYIYLLSACVYMLKIDADTINLACLDWFRTPCRSDQFDRKWVTARDVSGAFSECGSAWCEV